MSKTYTTVTINECLMKSPEDYHIENTYKIHDVDEWELDELIEESGYDVIDFNESEYVAYNGHTYHSAQVYMDCGDF